MAASFVSRIERVEPDRVLLTSRGSARIRVVGSALGWVRCGDERRWALGRFDETFVMQTSRAALEIKVVGLFGFRRQRVEVTALFDLRPPRVAASTPRLRFASPRVPRLRALEPADLAVAERRGAP
jgi:hypothetical protein